MSQRFIGTFSEDGKRIEGMWEIAHDRSTYEKDFDVVYRKALWLGPAAERPSAEYVSDLTEAPFVAEESTDAARAPSLPTERRARLQYL